MATEDERYRKSSQFRLWSFTPANLQELRQKTNALAQQQIAPRLATTADFLTPDEEQSLIRFYTNELMRASDHCKLPTEARSTAAIFFRRFYVTNSIMTYPPVDLLKTSLFFGCKAEGMFVPVSMFVENLGKESTTAEGILAGEYLLCQGIRFAFDVRHPFRALEGAILELRRRMPDQDARINKAHKTAREVLKFSPLMTDAYFHYAPSQIMMAALQMADEELVDMLVPGKGTGDETATGAHTHVRDRIMGAIEQCRAMLEEEPPERFNGYWDPSKTPETSKSFKPLRRKHQRCRDPDRTNLVALQKARRKQALNKDKSNGEYKDGDVFGREDRDAKRRKVEKADDPFGPPL